VAKTTIRHVRSINLTYAAGGHGELTRFAGKTTSRTRQ
jgi:hypothetical protein